MRKLLIFFSLLFSLLVIGYSLFVSTALAVCPVCTIAVAGGLGLSRWLGIDDTISGIWIGGLLLSSSLWLIDWLRKKNYELRIKNYECLVIAAVYILALLPLWFGKIIGHPFNTVLGIDKLIFGTTVGSLGFLFGVWLDKKVRKIKGKQLFKYQKIVFPVGILVIISLIIYYLVAIKI